MRIQMEIKNEPKKDDVLIYNGYEWEAISKAKLLFDIKKEIESIKNDFAEKCISDAQFKQAVNEKLKEHHEVLKVLVK